MKTIVCFGDSNTWGCPPIAEWPITKLDRYDAAGRWGGVLRAALGSDFCVVEEGLGGRTTVWDDPIMGQHRNGRRYLLPCLESHAPVDLVAIMLGTCDLKSRFGLSPSDVAGGMGVLIDVIKTSAAGPGGGAPQVLVISPPHVERMTILAEDFAGAEKKSEQLPRYYSQLAKERGCFFLAAGDVARASGKDGVHFEPAEQEKLGRAVAAQVKRILCP